MTKAELIEAVAGYYSEKLEVKFSPAQVIIGPGSKSLIYGLQMVLGADVFLPTPSWVSYAPQATLLGNRHWYVPASVENNYQLEIDKLDEVVTRSKKRSPNSPRLLVINSPNNPTGQMFSAEFLQELADYCRTNDILVLSDEIYFQVSHADVEHVSISRFYPEGTFVLGGLSKHLSIGGWRVGVALLPDTEFGRQLMQHMVIVASENWSSVSAPIQYAAIKAYSLDPEVEQYVADCCAIHGMRSQMIRTALSNTGIRCTEAHGAFYTTANFNSFRAPLANLGVTTSGELARYLLDTYRIATLPGADFGIPETELSLRLSTSYLDMEKSGDPQRIFNLYKSGIGSKTIMSNEHHPVTHQALNAFTNFVTTLQE